METAKTPHNNTPAKNTLTNQSLLKSSRNPSQAEAFVERGGNRNIPFDFDKKGSKTSTILTREKQQPESLMMLDSSTIVSSFAHDAKRTSSSPLKTSSSTPKTSLIDDWSLLDMDSSEYDLPSTSARAKTLTNTTRSESWVPQKNLVSEGTTANTMKLAHTICSGNSSIISLIIDSIFESSRSCAAETKKHSSASKNAGEQSAYEYIREIQLLEKSVITKFSPSILKQLALAYSLEEKIQILGIALYYDLFNDFDLSKIALYLIEDATVEDNLTKINKAILRPLKKCNNQTLLALAISKKKLTFIKTDIFYFIKDYAKKNPHPLKQCTEDYISIAIENHMFTIIEELREYGAQVSSIGSLLSFDTMYFISTDAVRILEELLKTLPDQSLEDLGSIEKFIEIVFVQYGVYTPPSLSIAILQKIKNINVRFPKTKLYQKEGGNRTLVTFEDSGFTLLHLCALYGLTELIPFLLSKNADVGISSKILNYTPLFYAALSPHYPTLIILVQNQKNTISNDICLDWIHVSSRYRQTVDDKKQLNDQSKVDQEYQECTVLMRYTTLQLLDADPFDTKVKFYTWPDAKTAAQEFSEFLKGKPSNSNASNTVKIDHLETMIQRGCPSDIVLPYIKKLVNDKVACTSNNFEDSILMLAIEKMAATGHFPLLEVNSPETQKKLSIGCVKTDFNKYISENKIMLDYIIDQYSGMIPLTNKLGKTALYLAIQKRLPQDFIMRLLQHSNPLEKGAFDKHEGIRIPDSLCLLMVINDWDLFEIILAAKVQIIDLKYLHQLLALSILWGRENFFHAIVKFILHDNSKNIPANIAAFHLLYLNWPKDLLDLVIDKKDLPFPLQESTSSKTSTIALEQKNDFHDLFILLFTLLEHNTPDSINLIHCYLKEGTIPVVAQYYPKLITHSLRYAPTISVALIEHLTKTLAEGKDQGDITSKILSTFIEPVALITLCMHHNHPPSAIMLLKICGPQHFSGEYDTKKNNALHITVEKGYLTIFNSILYYIQTHDTVASWIEHQNDDGQRPLDIAVQTPSVQKKMIESLLALTQAGHAKALDTLLNRMVQEYLPIDAIYPFLENQYKFTLDTHLESTPELLMIRLIKIKSANDKDRKNLFQKIAAFNWDYTLFLSSSEDALAPVDVIINQGDWLGLEVLLTNIDFIKRCSSINKKDIADVILTKLLALNHNSLLTKINTHIKLFSVIEDFAKSQTHQKKIELQNMVSLTQDFLKKLIDSYPPYTDEQQNNIIFVMNYLLSDKEDPDFCLFAYQELTCKMQQDITSYLKDMTYLSLVAVLIQKCSDLQKRPETSEKTRLEIKTNSRKIHPSNIHAIHTPKSEDLIQCFSNSSQQTAYVETAISHKKPLFKKIFGEKKSQTSAIENSVPREQQADEGNQRLNLIQKVNDIIDNIKSITKNVTAMQQHSISSTIFIL